MILRVVAAAVLLGLAACQPALKGPGETGQPVYYDPARGISSDGKVYPRS